ncbi:MAG TPA: hypothetical protein ENI62_01305 [Gammaproteobacteria bacterium]|nr:hypothetical protein [Gammaproteobacteria bacterium]
MKISPLVPYAAITLVTSLILLFALDASAATVSKPLNSSSSQDLTRVETATSKYQGGDTGEFDALLNKVMVEMDVDSALPRSSHGQNRISMPTAQHQDRGTSSFDTLLNVVMTEMEPDPVLASFYRDLNHPVTPNHASNSQANDPMYALVNRVFWDAAPVVEKVSQVTGKVSKDMID